MMDQHAARKAGCDDWRRQPQETVVDQRNAYRGGMPSDESCGQTRYSNRPGLDEQASEGLVLRERCDNRLVSCSLAVTGGGSFATEE